MRRTVVALALALGALSFPTPLGAEEPTKDPIHPPSAAPVGAPETPPEASASDPSPAPAVVAAPSPDDVLRARAQHIRALIEGTLDPGVNADALFVLDAADPAWAGAAEPMRELLAGIDRAEAEADDSKGSKAKRPPEPEEPPATGAQALVDAYIAFFAQPRQTRNEQLEAHRQARAQAEAEAKHDEVLRERARRLEQRAVAIETFLAGQADPSLDLDALLRRDLISEDSPTQSVGHRARFLAKATAKTPASPEDKGPGPGDPDPAALEDSGDEPDPSAPSEESPDEADDAVSDVLGTAQDRYDAAWLALDRLSLAERREIVRQREEALAAAAALAAEPVEEPVEDTVVVQSALAVQDADQRAESAALEREKALTSAREARSESLRVLAEERAALLSIKEAQARFSGELERRRGQVATLHETALEWERKVAALDTTADETAAADEMYYPLRERLGLARTDLRDLLDRLGSLGSTVPDPTQVPKPSGDIDRAEVDALRSELATQATELRTTEAELVWGFAIAVRDDTVAMNRARLRLLELASPELRGSITGLGDEGFDQVQRELEQIGLELRFQGRAWPRIAGAQVEAMRSRPLGLTFGILQLVVVLGMFIAWRRSADGILGRWRERMLARGIDARSSNFASTVLYYVRRVRSPIEWWAIALFVSRVAVDLEQFPELRLFWLVASWSLVGWTLVLTLDAVAARQSIGHQERLETAELRLYSLGLVCYTVVTVGLVISLTEEMVGVGAIYGWMWRFCWVLTFPVAFRLVQKWRPVVFERIDATGGRDAVSRWVATQRTGWRSYVGGLVGGVYLLLFGLSRWGGRLLQGAEITRRLLAYLFRRSVTRRARNDEVDIAPVPESVREVLGPEHPTDVLIPIMDDVAEELVELLLHNDSAMVAVVGERGSGKSTFLRRLAADPELGHSIRVECPPGGVDATFAALGAALGTSADPAEIQAALLAFPSLRVFVDDVQRLVRPTIGGLGEFDRFAEFARQAGRTVDWVFGIGAPVWGYLCRARADRMTFDRVVELKSWSDAKIGELLIARSKDAELTPSFERLATGVSGRAPLPDEVERAALGFYRMLWDSADGNPGVALEIWRSSLWTREGMAEAEVRLFHEPAAAEIERLPLAALFVLRTIVQLERAAFDDIVECTRLNPAEVHECITASLVRGYAERSGDRVRISWPWYRTITRVLSRQHLLGN